MEALKQDPEVSSGTRDVDHRETLLPANLADHDCDSAAGLFAIAAPDISAKMLHRLWLSTDSDRRREQRETCAARHVGARTCSR
jgi:hypothetical protein